MLVDFAAVRTDARQPRVGLATSEEVLVQVRADRGEQGELALVDAVLLVVPERIGAFHLAAAHSHLDRSGEVLIVGGEAVPLHEPAARLDLLEQLGGESEKACIDLFSQRPKVGQAR